MDNMKHGSAGVSSNEGNRNAGKNGSAGADMRKSGTPNDTHQVMKHGHEDVRGGVGELAKINGKG